MRALLGATIALLALLCTGPALAEEVASDPSVDVSLSLDVSPAIELGTAIQVARGHVYRSADGQVSIELRNGTRLPVRWPAGLPLPVGSLVVVAGTSSPNGPLTVTQVLPAS